MSTLDDIKTLLTQQSAAIENVARDIAKLIAQIPAEGSISDEDAKALRDTLTAQVARLTEVANIVPDGDGSPENPAGGAAGETSGSGGTVNGAGDHTETEAASETRASRRGRH